MDAARFDRFTRLLSGKASRRAGVGAALAVLISRGAADAIGNRDDCVAANKVCDPDRFWKRNSCKKCCSGFTTVRSGKTYCGCTPVRGGCSTSAACCNGRQCTYGACGGPECLPEGGECRRHADCCSNFCREDGFCKPDPSGECFAPGHVCARPGGCCSGICNPDGRCA